MVKKRGTRVTIKREQPDFQTLFDSLRGGAVDYAGERVRVYAGERGHLKGDFTFTYEVLPGLGYPVREELPSGWEVEESTRGVWDAGLALAGGADQGGLSARLNPDGFIDLLGPANAARLPLEVIARLLRHAGYTVEP